MEDEVQTVTEFCCPKCGGSWFGSSMKDGKVVHVSCHDQHQIGCRFSSEGESRELFVEKPRPPYVPYEERMKEKELKPKNSWEQL